ncbi:MAG: hypothetical protein IIC53_16470, partial [Proteobacteria bacterium]|nr:hypothetical protein [Pseudomonadota bacterium]
TKLKVAKVAKRLAKAQNMRMEVDDSVYDKIVEQCDQVDIGARNIDRVLDQKILPVISRRLLERMTEDTMPTVLTMGTDASGEFTYTFSD